jgi:hypothetical protein
VILSTLLLHLPDSIWLIVCCGIGFCAGIYLFFRGFRLRRRLILATPSSKAHGNFPDDSVLAEEGIAPVSHPSPAQIIRLSTEASPTKAADMTQQQRIAAALMKAGVTTPAAWATGVADQTVQVSAPPVVMNTGQQVSNPGNGGDISVPQDGTPNGFEPHPPVVLMKGTNDETVLISCCSQQDVARSLEWKCALMTWGGPVLALLCLYFLLNSTHVL